MAPNSMLMGCAARHAFGPFAALLLSAAICGAAQRENPAAAIAAAAGHPAHLHLVARTQQTILGQDATSTLEIADGKRLVRDCVGDLCRGTWFDGRHAAAFGINEAPLANRAADAAERTSIAIASTAFGEADFLAAGGTVERLASAADQLRYRVAAPGGAELIAVADARTRRLAGIDFPDGRRYRDLIATSAGPTVMYAERSYAGVTVATGAIEPPSGPPLRFGSGPEIALLADDLPIIPCRIDGTPVRCLLDTGTTPSAVSLGLAERLGLEPRGAIDIEGFSTYLTGVVQTGPVTLGAATLGQLRFAVIPRLRDARFDVILGSDAFAGLRLTFDHDRRRVSIAEPAGESADRSISVDFPSGVPIVQVRLGNRERSESMLLDTGDTQTLAIGYDEYRTDMSLFAVRGRAVATGTGPGSNDALTGELDRADIDGAIIERVAISAVRGQHGGHLGYGFVARCGRFVVELGAGRMECGNASAAVRPSAGDP